MTSFTTKTAFIAFVSSLAAVTTVDAFTPSQALHSKIDVSSTRSSLAMTNSPDSSHHDNLDRRMFGKTMATGAAALLTSSTWFPTEPAEAALAQQTGRPKVSLGGNRVYFKGKITLQSDTDIPSVSSNGNEKNKNALILTARPKNSAKVPPEVLRAGRGNVPAVFTAIIPNPDVFPQAFKLTSRDITPEGDFGLSGDAYWWADEPEWEISARLDTDGSLRTASPKDLVGRTITSQIGEDKAEQEVCVAVQERGFWGSRSQRKQTA